MTDVARIEQRDSLMSELGMLLGPLRSLLFTSDEDRRAIPLLRSRYGADRNAFEAKVREFCSFREFLFEQEMASIASILKQLRLLFDVVAGLQESSRVPPVYEGPGRVVVAGGRITQVTNYDEARSIFVALLKEAQKVIRDVPCDEPGLVVPPTSPLQAYYRLRAECAAAAVRLDIFEPYLSPDVYHRYLRGATEGVKVTIVTDDAVMTSQRQRDTRRRDEIVSISELWSIERPTNYAFYVTNLHDRHIRIDDRVLHLGGSLKDAARAADPFTIGLLEPSIANHQSLDQIVAAADEWYGPNVRPHRKS